MTEICRVIHGDRIDVSVDYNILFSHRPQCDEQDPRPGSTDPTRIPSESSSNLEFLNRKTRPFRGSERRLH